MRETEHFIYSIHFRVVVQQHRTPSLTVLLTSALFYAAFGGLFQTVKHSQLPHRGFVEVAFFPTCCKYCGGKKSSPLLFVPTHFFFFSVYSVHIRCLHCAPVWSLMFHLFFFSCIRILVGIQREVVE